MSWFTVRDSDDVVLGWVRSQGATPANANGLSYFDQNFDAGLALYNQLENELIADGRGVAGNIVRQGATLVKVADGRPAVDVAADKTVVDADGVDSVTLTVTRTDNATFTGSRTATFTDDNRTRRIKFDFTLGVATKVLTSTVSGTLSFRSNSRFKVNDPIDIEFVD